MYSMTVLPVAALRLQCYSGTLNAVVYSIQMATHRQGPSSERWKFAARVLIPVFMTTTSWTTVIKEWVPLSAVTFLPLCSPQQFLFFNFTALFIITFSL